MNCKAILTIDIMPKMFLINRHLKIHIMLHTEEKPSICNKSCQLSLVQELGQSMLPSWNEITVL